MNKKITQFLDKILHNFEAFKEINKSNMELLKDILDPTKIGQVVFLHFISVA